MTDHIEKIRRRTSLVDPVRPYTVHCYALAPPSIPWPSKSGVIPLKYRHRLLQFMASTLQKIYIPVWMTLLDNESATVSGTSS